MPNKPVALVTGANQGIGLQIAKDLVPHGFTVLVGSRSFEKGQTAAKNIGAVPVLDSGKLLGILSERDYTRKVILQGKSSKKTRISPN